MNFIDKLPTILLEITFNHLHYKQKIQCKLVCRLWNHILSSGLDVETLTIRKKPEFTAFIGSAPNISLSCKKLMLCHYQHLPIVARIFPNLKLFVFKPMDENKHAHQNQLQYNRNQNSYFSNWHKNLQIFINLQIYNETHPFLHSGVFQRLTILVLGHTELSSKSRTDIIFSLKNAPRLQILQLKGFLLRYHDLNVLHHVATYLHTLILDHCSTVYLELVNFESNPPAKAMKRLILTGADKFILDNGELLKFMALKYPGLKHLSITTYQAHEVWKSVIPLMIRGRNLITFNIDTHTGIPNLVTELKESIATGLKELTINLSSDKVLFGNVIQLVDSSNIDSLSLVDNPHISLDAFKTLDKLKHLRVDFSKRLYSSKLFAVVNMVVKELPKSLETLSLSNVQLSIILKNDGEIGNCYQSNLKRLEVHKSIMMNNSLLYLSSSCFPKLDQLILSHNYRHSCLLLPDKRFSLVKINILGEPLKLTVGENKTYYFDVPRDEMIPKRNCIGLPEYAMRIILKPSPMTNANQEYLHFQCKSVQNLLYNDYLLLV